MTNDTDIQARAREIAAELSPMQRAHVQHGIGGATDRTLTGLSRRGLVEAVEHETWGETWRLSDLGRAVATVLAEGTVGK